MTQFGENFNFTGLNDKRQEHINKSFKSDQIEKGGKGSGRKIGYTKSGKPVYSHKKASEYKDFTKQDHEDAYQFHAEVIEDDSHSSEVQNHSDIKDSHDEIIDKLSKKDIKKSEENQEFIFHTLNTDLVKSMDTSSTPGKEDVEGKKKDKIDDFKHHRLMAGFHATKQKEASKHGIDLHASTDPEVHKEAKGKEGESSRHEKLVEQHLEKAKSLHNKEKHGEWNKTIPTTKEALEYGNKYASKVDKGIDTKDAVKDSKIKKSLEIEDSIDILKGGEGSKGGEVIGHTKSGKVIYSHAKSLHDYKFNRKEHNEAATLHNSKSKELIEESKKTTDSHEKNKIKKEAQHHFDQSTLHEQYMVEDKERVEKSEIENLSKSDLTWQFSQEQFNVSKKGSELTTLATAKLARLNEQKLLLLSQLQLSKESVIKLLPEFKFDDSHSNGIGYDVFKRDEVGELYDPLYTCRDKYNGCCYAIKSIQDDITFLTTFIGNLEAGKTYKLSVQQISTLEKSEENTFYTSDINEVEETLADRMQKAIDILNL